jgi:hypothetical protein
MGMLAASGSERPLRVDSRHLALAHRPTAVGGFLPFTGTRSSDKVAPRAAIGLPTEARLYLTPPDA